MKKNIIAGIFVSSLLLTGCSGLADETERRDSESSSFDQDQRSVGRSGNDDSTSEDTDESKEVKEEDNSKVAIGKEVTTDNGITIKATKVFKNNGGDFIKPEKGNSFFLMEFEITNNSDEPEVISSILQFDAYLDSTHADATFTEDFVEDTQTLDDENLLIGEKLVGTYAVEGPSNSKVMEVEFRSDPYSKKILTFEGKVK